MTSNGEGARLVADARPPMSPRRLVGTLVVGVMVLVGLTVAVSDPFTLMFFVAYVGVASILLARQPGNVVAWLLLGIGFGFITTTTPGLDVEALRNGTADLATWLRVWVSSWGGTMSYIGFLALAVVFPTGRLPAGLLGRLAALTLVTTSALVAVMALAPTMAINPTGDEEVLLRNPFSVLPDAGFWQALPAGSTALTIVPVIVALLLAAVGMIVRYRRSTGILRLQLRWLVASLAAVVLGVLFGMIASTAFGDVLGGLAWLPVVFAFPSVPIAVGVAVTRYRLFEIDRLISRSITYGLITVALFALFGLVNLGAQAVLQTAVQGDTVAVALSTLVVAATFNPLRVRLQRIVDRRFNRARYDQERILSSFSVGLREDLDVDRVLEHVQDTVGRAVEPRSVTVWRRDQHGAA